MKQLLFTTLLIVTLTGKMYAQTTPYFNGYPAARWPVKDNPLPEEYKLSHDDFETTYGVNDTACAIIHMYFRKRNFGLRLAYITSTATSVAGRVAAAQADAQAPVGQINAPVDRQYPGWIYPTVGVGLPVTLYGFIQAASWSRIECYRVLRRYAALHQLPPKVRRRLPRMLALTRSGDLE